MNTMKVVRLKLRDVRGLIADRDVVGSWNIRLRGLKSLKIDVGSPVPPESPSMNPETGRLSATHASKVMKVAESQNGCCEEAVWI